MKETIPNDWGIVDKVEAIIQKKFPEKSEEYVKAFTDFMLDKIESESMPKELREMFDEWEEKCHSDIDNLPEFLDGLLK